MISDDLSSKNSQKVMEEITPILQRTIIPKMKAFIKEKNIRYIDPNSYIELIKRILFYEEYKKHEDIEFIKKIKSDLEKDEAETKDIMNRFEELKNMIPYRDMLWNYNYRKEQNELLSKRNKLLRLDVNEIHQYKRLIDQLNPSSSRYKEIKKKYEDKIKKILRSDIGEEVLLYLNNEDELNQMKTNFAEKQSKFRNLDSAEIKKKISDKHADIEYILNRNERYSTLLDNPMGYIKEQSDNFNKFLADKYDALIKYEYKIRFMKEGKRKQNSIAMLNRMKDAFEEHARRGERVIRSAQATVQHYKPIINTINGLKNDIEELEFILYEKTKRINNDDDE